MGPDDMPAAFSEPPVKDSGLIRPVLQGSLAAINVYGVEADGAKIRRRAVKGN